MKQVALGRYTLLERIAHGGMAEVFRARAVGEVGFERIVAIKVLLPNVASDDELVTMLIDEAKIAGQLTHSNIAQIFDLGRAGDRHYIVQEFVDGLDLRRVLAHLGPTAGGIGVARACHVVLKVCEALDYAHGKRDAKGQPLNVVHRDVGPQNVMVSWEGEVKLIDFGIARAEGRATRTVAGAVKGKFAYMSPEQLRGLPVDRRADVFACGALFHELLTGRQLFGGDTDYQTMERVRAGEIAPPGAEVTGVPPALDRIVLKALERDIDARYQTALELRDDLGELVQAESLRCSRDDLAAWMRRIREDDALTDAITRPRKASQPRFERAPSAPPPPEPSAADLEDVTQIDPLGSRPGGVDLEEPVEVAGATAPIATADAGAARWPRVRLLVLVALLALAATVALTLALRVADGAAPPAPPRQSTR